MKRMRIAMFVTNRFPLSVQNKTFAPIWIHNEIALGLKKLGHQITIFASKESHLGGIKVVSGGMVSLENASVPRDKGFSADREKFVSGKLSSLYQQAALSELYAQAEQGKFDIVHVHPIDLALPLAHIAKRVPTIATLHDPLTGWRQFYHSLYLKERGVYYVSISNSQRKPMPKLNYAATIYHGVNTKQFQFSPRADDYFVHVARITPEKGTHIAALAAKQAGVRLKIVGEASHKEYFEKKVRPLLSERIQYVGFKRPDHVQELFEHAKGLVLPLQWDEPFGLVMIEAMACGTPVIAYPRGSAPELILPGKTGFLPKNLTELKQSMKKVSTIDRLACREHVEKQFSLERMAKDYERVFRQVIQDYN